MSNAASPTAAEHGAATAQPEADNEAPQKPTIWGTKGIGFWALLMAILLKARPESILELGGGRSTTMLGDYAFRYRKPFVSVEQSEVWHRKVSDDLLFMNVRQPVMHHVPLDPAGDPPWYDEAEFRRVVGGRAYDLVFLDGPVGSGRRNVKGQKLVAHAARNARWLIVDDVHRPAILDQFRTLSARFPPEGIFYYQYGSNELGLAVTAEWSGLVAECFAFLELAFTRDAIVIEQRRSGDA